MAKAGEGLRRVPKGSGCMCVDSKCPPRSGLCIFVGGWFFILFLTLEIFFNG